MKHIVPSRFMRIRHYGYLANANKKESLAKIRECLGVKAEPSNEAQSTGEWIEQLLGENVTRCPDCGATLREEKVLPFRARKMSQRQGM